MCVLYMYVLNVGGSYISGLLCHLHFWTLQPLFPAIIIGGATGMHSYQHKGTGWGVLGDCIAVNSAFPLLEQPLNQVCRLM